MQINLMLMVNKLRFLVQHELHECKCRFNQNVCYSKQNQKPCKCRWECEELNDWSSCKNDCMWNSSACDCECNKACKIDE